jgi:LacI family transcriptional regulator
MTESPELLHGSVPDAQPEAARPTLKTIAGETGLAIATVSRALKDASDIGEETKRRVREVAERLGYRPNRAGVRLRTGKTNVIALVMSTEDDVMNHTSQLIYSIAAALRGTAYHLVVMPYFPDEDPMTPIRYLVETGSADGAIINQTTSDDARVRYMAAHGFPFATHGRTETGIDHPYYDFDNESFARIGAEALIARGRRRLMLVAPPEEHSYGGHMIKGFAEAAARHGIAAERMAGVTSDSPAAVIEAAARVRMARDDRPDGMLFGSTTAAMSVVAGAESCGLRIGADFDAVAKEAIRFLHRFRREMIVVHEQVADAGGFLARAVIADIEHKPDGPRQFVDRPTMRDLQP